MKPEKIIVAVGLEEQTDLPLAQLTGFGFHPESELIFVHVIPLILYARGLSFEHLTYPEPDERAAIEESILQKLSELHRKILPGIKKASFHCLFGSDTRAVLTDFINSEKAGMVVIATRGRHGIANLFDSSMAQYLLKFCPSKLLVLR